MKHARVSNSEVWDSLDPGTTWGPHVMRATGQPACG
jgi:hypothetical protein